QTGTANHQTADHVNTAKNAAGFRGNMDRQRVEPAVAAVRAGQPVDTAVFGRGEIFTAGGAGDTLVHFASSGSLSLRTQFMPIETESRTAFPGGRPGNHHPSNFADRQQAFAK